MSFLTARLGDAAVGDVPGCRDAEMHGGCRAAGLPGCRAAGGHLIQLGGEYLPGSFEGDLEAFGLACQPSLTGKKLARRDGAWVLAT